MNFKPLCEVFEEPLSVVSHLARCVAHNTAARVTATKGTSLPWEGGEEVREPRHQEGYIPSCMDFFEDALSLCTLLSSMEVSQLHVRPRTGIKRRRTVEERRVKMKMNVKREKETTTKRRMLPIKEKSIPRTCMPALLRYPSPF